MESLLKCTNLKWKTDANVISSVAFSWMSLQKCRRLERESALVYTHELKNERQNMQKWWENTHKIQHQNDECKTIDWRRENGWKKTSSKFLQNIHFISFVIVFCRFWIRKTSILSILFAGANCLICVLKEKAKNRENKRKHNNEKGTLPFQIAAGYEHILELLGNSHFQRTWNLVSIVKLVGTFSLHI